MAVVPLPPAGRSGTRANPHILNASSERDLDAVFVTLARLRAALS
jgi:hypothetical protein